MKQLSRTLCAVLLTFAPLPAPSSFGQTPTRPGASQPTPKKQQGFFDYVLGKVNPSGNDYGATVQSEREAMVASTVDDLYFWSNAMTLLLLTGSVAIVFLQWRSEAKREIVASALIAELWNGRVSDKVEIDRRTEQFNRLVATHNAEVERALTLTQQSVGSEKQTAGNLNRSVRKLTETAAGPSQKGLLAETTAVETAAVPTADPSASGLQQSNLLLQRRIEAMQNTKQNLEQRLNQTAALLDQERRRNAALKGA